jgi:hypothetical protein
MAEFRIRMTSWLVFALAAVMVACPIGARADRAIETPSGAILSPLSGSVEGILGVDRHGFDDQWINGSIQVVEIEDARLESSRRQADSLSAQVGILPETILLPSLSVGVRDIFDTTRQFGDLGYSGRSLYIAACKSNVSFSPARFPFRNWSVTAGLGTGVTNGLFGSVSADLAFGCRQTFEYDGRSVNYRISHVVGPNGRLEFERLHGANFVGLELSSPVRM